MGRQRFPFVLVLIFTLQFTVSDAGAAGLAPSFIKVGKTYMAPQWKDMPFKVVTIGEEGWIRVQTEDGTFWLNTNVIPVLIEMDEEGNAEWNTNQRQKKTMSDIRAIATACEAFAVDYNYYPVANSIRDLAAILQPVYIRSLPFKDAWGFDYGYAVETGGQNYWIFSYGEDGRREESIYNSAGIPALQEARETTDPKSDIIFSSGSFLRFPKEATIE